METPRHGALRLFYFCVRCLFPESENERLVQKTTRADLETLFLPRMHGDVVTLLPYRHQTIRALIWQLKYKRDMRAAKLLGEILALHIRVYEQPLIVPIPLSGSRARERGYNQVTLVAEAAVAHLPRATILPKALYWTREVPHQTTLGRRERIENITGALRAQSFETNGRAVIILDDVMTTGSTLRAARQALEDIGVRDPILVALAH